MKLNLESLNRSEFSVEVVSANTADPLEIVKTGRFAILQSGPGQVNEVFAGFEDAEAPAFSNFEEIMAPLVGSLATLNPDGSISYDFDANFAAMNFETIPDEVRDDHTDSVFFGSDWQVVEQEEMLAPIAGAIATLNVDGSILYTSHQEMKVPEPGNSRQSIHHATRTSSLNEPETVILAR